MKSRRPARGRVSSTVAARRIGLAVAIAASLYALFYLDRGWVPHDEGTLAQPAARVLLDGELPHRDFDDVYTGGQALYHAALFRVLGVDLLSLRWGLLGAFILTLPLLWYVARRFAGPVAAGGTLLVAAAWCIPVYPAAMPSWYTLFLAVAAVAAGLRHLEMGRRRWLVIAGFCAGLSVVVKITGLYLLAALLLFAVHHEQETSRRAVRPASRSDRMRERTYRGFLTGGLVLFVASVTLLVGRFPTPATALHFLVPPAIVAAWLGIRVWRWEGCAPGRFRRLGGLVLAVLAGAAVPVAAFLAPYVPGGGLEALWNGVFVSPAQRFTVTARPPPPALTVLPLAALAAAGWWAARAGVRYARGLALGAGVVLAAVLLFSGTPAVYRAAWWLIRPLVPVLAGAAILWLARADPWPEDVPGAGGKEGLFLVLSVTTMVSLVQFPTSAPVYFFYVGPLAALLAVAVVSRLMRPPWLLVAVVAAFQLVFAVRWIHPGWVYQMGDHFAAHPPTRPLSLERGGIRVTAPEKAEMEALVAHLQVVSPEPFVFATPDAPEVPFLAGKRNPTRILFDFFDTDEERAAEIRRLLERDDVGAVVLNTGAARFSSLPSLELQREIAERFPRIAPFGRFAVRWKAGRGPGPDPGADADGEAGAQPGDSAAARDAGGTGGRSGADPGGRR